MDAAGLGVSLKPALLRLVREREAKSSSIIVYTTFQAHADEVAGYLYVNGVTAVSYHAGKFDRVRITSIDQLSQALQHV